MAIFPDDPFGDIRRPTIRGGATSREVADFHAQADVDASIFSMHHTLGVQHHQASFGDHKHNGKDSVRIDIATLVTGDLSVPGSLTVAGNLTVTGNLVVSGIGQTLFARKSANQTLNTTTLTNDNHLFLSLDANSTYLVDLYIIYDGPVTGSPNLAFTIPSGATWHWVPLALSTGTGAENAAQHANIIRMVDTTGTTNRSIGDPNTTDDLVATPRGIIRTTNAGTLQLQWAQKAADASTLTFRTDSHIRAVKVA